MRARNIKPGFFTNEALSECQPLARILFIGLWCLSAADGKLEDRPKKIKAAIFPFDNCDVDRLLQELHESGLIRRYQVGGKKCIFIPTFAKHQRPHPDEKKRLSGLPDPPVDEPESQDNEAENDEAEPEKGAREPEKNPARAPESTSEPEKKPVTCAECCSLNAEVMNDDSPPTPPHGGADGDSSTIIPFRAPESPPPAAEPAASLAAEFSFVCTRRRPGSGLPQYPQTPRALSGLATEIGETLRLGVRPERLREEINRPTRDRSEWYGELSRRLLREIGVADERGHGRGVGPDSRVHAPPGKYDAVGTTADANDVSAEAPRGAEPAAPAGGPPRAGGDRHQPPRGHPLAGAG